MKSINMLMMAALTILSVGVFAQDKTLQKTKKQKNENAIFICPVHSDVMMDEFGKCPKCGRDLTKSPKEQMKMEVMKIYTCPMHQDVTSNKPGKCSKCNMDLKEKKDNHSNH